MIDKRSGNRQRLLMANPKFQFYEVVRLAPTRSEQKALAGGEGVVLGMAANEAGEWSYAVSVTGTDSTRSFEEEDLESTGRIRTREEFYPGGALRVSREGKVLD